MHDKCIFKGYSEAVNVHSATMTAAISHFKNIEIEAEVNKNKILAFVYRNLEGGQALQGWGMSLESDCTEHRATALSTLFFKKAIVLSLNPQPLVI